MTRFTIEPFVGPLPLRFGMSSNEVKAVLGEPNEGSMNWAGNWCESRADLNLGFSGDKTNLKEAIFLPTAKLFFGEHDLFAVPDPIELLRAFDADPQLCVGFVVFLKLGVRFSGFHDKDESQKAIGVTPRGHYDQEDFEDEFEPFLKKNKRRK